MPELPEVESTVRGLKKNILGHRILDVWTDNEKMIKRPRTFKDFKKELRGVVIENVRRRGKNILIDLSGKRTLLIHQKLTGHLLVGRWKLKKGKWISKVSGPLFDDLKNDYIHLIIFLDENKDLALSDLRKFAKIELWNRKDLESSEGFSKLGPEPLEKGFTFNKFKQALKTRKGGKIKQVLMDQNVIVGIGNIYSDEILWRSKIHPFKDVSNLSDIELKGIYQSMKVILKKAVKLKGTSISDFRLINGSKGHYQTERKAYQRQGKKCSRCGGEIQRKKIGARSAHFCPTCQKL